MRDPNNDIEGFPNLVAFIITNASFNWQEGNKNLVSIMIMVHQNNTLTVRPQIPFPWHFQSSTQEML